MVNAYDQPQLDEWMSDVWSAAIADAGLGADTHLVLIPLNRPDCGGFPSVLFRSAKPVDPNIEGFEYWNGSERFNCHRIFVSTQRCDEEVAALIRHELEHVCQYNFDTILTDGMRVENLLSDLHAIAWVPGLDSYSYQQIPTEMHANAAASRFARDRYPRTIDSVIEREHREGRNPRALFETYQRQPLEIVRREMCERYWPGWLDRLRAYAIACKCGKRRDSAAVSAP